MSKNAKLLELAERCEAEAVNWIGRPMRRGLLKIARQMRSIASQEVK